jgi:hypothetical protein
MCRMQPQTVVTGTSCNLQVIGSLLQEVRKPAQSPTEMKQKAQDHSVGDFPGGPPPERSAMLPEEAFQRGG